MSEPATPAPDPMDAARRRFLETYAGILAPVSPAQPLDARIAVAFDEGWRACRRQVLVALAQASA